MNKSLLEKKVQDFIWENEDIDVVSLLLKKPVFDSVSNQELAQQLESRKKSKRKLPSWYRTPNIYYPKKLNIEQTSSEITAAHKAQLVAGKTLIDLTGGFGVDTHYFSQKMEYVTHCEIDATLSRIVAYNLRRLKAKNVTTYHGDGLELLRQESHRVDWIYIDPSRRDALKGKVFRLTDCTPNVLESLDLFFEKSDNVLLKTSPLIDLAATIDDLSFIKEIHTVAVENEVKELLWILQKGFQGAITIKTSNYAKQQTEKFDFSWKEEASALSTLSKPLDYLYEPNAAILKSGAFKVLGQRFSLYKLHQNTHLYTNRQALPFPGRVFKVQKVLPYKKTALKEFKDTKAHVTIRNFRESVEKVRKKYRIKNGGDQYLFFCHLEDDKPYVIVCSKMN